MPILRFKTPADVLPFGIEPQSTQLWRQTGSTRITANVLNDSIQMLFVTDDSVVALLLPELASVLRAELMCLATIAFIDPNRSSSSYSGNGRITR